LGYVLVLYRAYGRSLENKVKRELKGIKMEGVDWIQLAQDKDKLQVLVDTPIKLQVP
jgi:hypothetical protein